MIMFIEKTAGEDHLTRLHFPLQFEKNDNNHIGPRLLSFNIIDVNVINVKILNFHLKHIWDEHLLKCPSWKRIAPFQNIFTFLLCHEPEATGLYTGCRWRFCTSGRLQVINRLYENRLQIIG